VMPWPGLSLLLVARKPAGPSATAAPRSTRDAETRNA